MIPCRLCHRLIRPHSDGLQWIHLRVTTGPSAHHAQPPEWWRPAELGRTDANLFVLWGTEYVAVPRTELDRLRRLEAAARVWAANRIPGTGVSSHRATNALIAALEELDAP